MEGTKTVEKSQVYRGRPLASSKRKRTPSERVIINVLERGGMRGCTFKELEKETELSVSTLSEHLRILEEDGEIERRIGRRTERGRERPKAVYVLSAKALDPVQKTLMRLDAVASPPTKLDIELGQKLLTEPVVAAIVEFNKSRKVAQFLEKIGIRIEPRFDEITLITTLAQYDFECNHLPKFFKRMSWVTDRKSYFELIPFLKKREMTEQFNKLLEWMKALLETPNLASELFNSWWLVYTNLFTSMIPAPPRRVVKTIPVHKGKKSTKMGEGMLLFPKRKLNEKGGEKP